MMFDEVPSSLRAHCLPHVRLLDDQDIVRYGNLS